MEPEPQQSNPLFALKTVHTLIFISLSWAVLYILYCGLANRVSRKTAVAFATLFVEAVVFWRNGWRG